MARELDRRGFDVLGVDLKRGHDCRALFRNDDRHYDLVVHCAFHVGGRAAIDGDASLLAKNLQIDSSLFDWARRTKQGRVLYFSSSAVYPVLLQQLGTLNEMHEDDIEFDAPELADGRYGLAKITGELMAAAARECGVQVSVVRPFSGYGELQDETYPFRAMVERARRTTVPQIFIGDTHVGGYDDMMALHRAGGLEPLLQGD